MVSVLFIEVSSISGVRVQIRGVHCVCVYVHPSQLEERFKLWKECISQAMKEKCKEEISMQTYLSSDVRNGSKTSSLLETRTKA